MSDEELVPRWLRVTFAILRAAPMTELKTAAGLVLLFATAAWLALSIVLHLEIRESVLDTWLLFLSGLLAISSFGQGWKQSVVGRVQTAAAASAKPGGAP
jgi:hypothetical protein